MFTIKKKSKSKNKSKNIEKYGNKQWGKKECKKCRETLIFQLSMPFSMANARHGKKET